MTSLRLLAVLNVGFKRAWDIHTLEDAASQRDSAAPAKTGCTQAYSAFEEVTFALTYVSPGFKV